MLEVESKLQTSASFYETGSTALTTKREASSSTTTTSTVSSKIEPSTDISSESTVENDELKPVGYQTNTYPYDPVEFKYNPRTNDSIWSTLLATKDKSDPYVDAHAYTHSTSKLQDEDPWFGEPNEDTINPDAGSSTESEENLSSPSNPQENPSSSSSPQTTFKIVENTTEKKATSLERFDVLKQFYDNRTTPVPSSSVNPLEETTKNSVTQVTPDYEFHIIKYPISRKTDFETTVRKTTATTKAPVEAMTHYVTSTASVRTSANYEATSIKLSVNFGTPQTSMETSPNYELTPASIETTGNYPSSSLVPTESTTSSLEVLNTTTLDKKFSFTTEELSVKNNLNRGE